MILRPLHLLGLQHIAFICGCGHTGTTLIATMLSMHPRLYVPLRESDAYLAKTAQEKRERLSNLRWEALHARKFYLVEKTPRHIRHLDAIRREIGDARFIIMVRDGRDVAASIGRRTDGDFDAGVERWLLDTSIALEQRGRADALVVRYEDLIADPRARLAEVCTFLRVPYTDRLLEYHQQPHLWYGRTDVRHTSGIGPQHEDLRNWQVNQPLFDGRGRWRTELPAAIVEKFNHGRAGEIMQAFGYAPEPA